MEFFLPIVENNKPSFWLNAEGALLTKEPESGVSWQPLDPEIISDNITFLKFYGYNSLFDLIKPKTVLRDSYEKLLIDYKTNLTCSGKHRYNIGDLYISHERDVLRYSKLFIEHMQKVFETFEKPKFYDYEAKLDRLLKRIYKRRINFLGGEVKPIRYVQNATKTGRLKHGEGFQFLTCSKEQCRAFWPRNHIFLSMDFNGADLRTLLFLLGKPQPSGDVYELFVSKEQSKEERSKVKSKVFKTLYSANSEENKAIFNKLKRKYYFNDGVITFFGRKHKCTQSLAVPYLVQSMQNENCLRRAIAVDDFLVTNNCKSFLQFLKHDEIFVDIHMDDYPHVPKLMEIMSNTDLGQFKVNAKLMNRQYDSQYFVPGEVPSQKIMATIEKRMNKNP